MVYKIVFSNFSALSKQQPKDLSFDVLELNC